MLSRKSTSRDRPAAVGCNRHGAMDLRTSAQQLKEEFGLDHFEGRSWHGLHRQRLMTMIAYAFLQHCRIAKTGGKKNGRATTSAQPAGRASRHRRCHSSAIRSAMPILQKTDQRKGTA